MVELAVIDPADAADGMGVEALHQRAGQLDAPAGIVVAGDHHDVQLRQALVGADDEVVEAFLGFQRWIDRVEDVAGYEQGVGLVGDELVEQPGEELGVFVVAVLTAEGLAEMPVGGVDQAHGRWVSFERWLRAFRYRPIAVGGLSIGFALLGESLLAVAGWPAPPKGTKKSCPSIRVSLRATSLIPSLLRGSPRKGHPWPFTAFAASMPLTPLRSDSIRPSERGVLSRLLVRVKGDKQIAELQALVESLQTIRT